MLETLKELNKLIEQYNYTMGMVERYKFIKDDISDNVSKVANALSETILSITKQLTPNKDNEILEDAINVLYNYVTVEKNEYHESKNKYFLSLDMGYMPIDEDEANIIINAYKIVTGGEI